MSNQTLLHILAILLLTWFASSIAGAHPATERYIPIGQSPGISGKYSYVGSIEERDDATHTMTVRTGTGTASITMDQKTRIYLDRSTVGKTGLKGSYADCRPGRRIEIKYVDNDPSKSAEWIKVEVTD